MNWLRELIWKRRQESRNIVHVERPVFDLINFGNAPGTVLDGAANRGEFAGEVLFRFPLMTVHCFEPNQDVCAEIKSQVERLGGGNAMDSHEQMSTNSASMLAEPGQDVFIPDYVRKIADDDAARFGSVGRFRNLSSHLADAF